VSVEAGPELVGARYILGGDAAFRSVDCTYRNPIGVERFDHYATSRPS
jgi:hypothetical protein